MLEDRFSMSVRDYVLRPGANEGSGPIIITLPPVSEAKGRSYSILCREADGINSITITDNDDSECWGDVIFYNNCESALFYSDGLYWHMLGALKFIFGQIFIKL
jgi:hypothetical protein